MRTLLFVQTGDARPKCVGEHNERESQWGKRLHGTVRQAKLKLASDRWWLVECENAYAGRFMIDPAWCNNRTTWPPPQGRILASGGKHVRV